MLRKSLVVTLMILVPVLLVTLPLFFLPKNNQTLNETTPSVEKDIRVLFPLPDASLSQSPISTSGEAKGAWFFEGSFPITVVDKDGNTLGTGVAKAQGEWMTENLVPFSAEIEIAKKYIGPASMIFKKDNPSGLPEKEESFIVPVNVNFSPEMMTVNVYFGKYSPDSTMAACDTLYPSQRTVLKTSSVAKAAIEELLKGITPAEKEAGFYTSINDNVALNEITIVDGVAKADFSEELERQVGGSCRVAAIRAQITRTLKQFSSVKSVIVSINGRTEDILQP